MSRSVELYKQQVREIAETVCKALQDESDKMGFPESHIDPDINRAEFSLSRDPASGEDSLVGIWRDPKGRKQGEILFHADGSFFAEYDVIGQHPKKKQWFVEAVTAWGRENTIKSEPKLLPAVE